MSFRNDQLLIAAGARKRAFKWFNKMAFCNSYTTALKKNAMLANNHDNNVKVWKNSIEDCGTTILRDKPDITIPELTKELKGYSIDEFDVSF